MPSPTSSPGAGPCRSWARAAGFVLLFCHSRARSLCVVLLFCNNAIGIRGALPRSRIGRRWGGAPQRQAQLLAATTPTSCSSTACRVVLGDPYYATEPAARLEPRAIAPRRSILLLSLWLRNLPFCFSCSHILFLFFEKCCMIMFVPVPFWNLQALLHV